MQGEGKRTAEPHDLFCFVSRIPMVMLFTRNHKTREKTRSNTGLPACPLFGLTPRAETLTKVKVSARTPPAIQRARPRHPYTSQRERETGITI